MAVVDAYHQLQVLIERARRDPGLPVSNPTISSWQSVPHEFANHQSLNLPSQVSIAVIGSGMTGISTAYHLLQEQPDLSVTVLEARSLISGATGRNGGHCKEVPYVDYDELKALHGKDVAGKILRFRLAQLDALFDVAGKLAPNVITESMLRRVEAVDLYFDRNAFETIKIKREEWLKDFPEERDRWLVWEGEDLDEACEYLQLPKYYHSRMELTPCLQRFGSVNAIGCMTGPAGALWPYKYVGGVVSALIRARKHPNFTIETNTPVESIVISEESEYPYEIITSRGAIQARCVIHCTNGHAGHLLPGLRGKLFPIRGQMTLQAVPPFFSRVGSKKSWTLHYCPGYDYITQSPLPTGEMYLGGGLLQALLSGNVLMEDIDVGNVRDDQQSEEALNVLEGVIEERFQNGCGARIMNKWTGIMGFTIDDLPMVGKVPSEISGRDPGRNLNNEWVAAGFNGSGMVHCWLTGKALAEMVLHGEENIGDWFPAKAFACSSERHQRASLEERISAFTQTIA
jgi:glycine/D-amino acid oxidase-like deaminating enzyme